MPLLLVGVDHRCADLDQRELVSYTATDAEDLLIDIIGREEIEEALLLSTCNRTEIYIRPIDPDPAFDLALDLVFASKAAVIRDEGRYYTKHRQEAVRHLLGVAAGLESMVLGEPEILGQVRQASALADGLGTSGAVLRHASRSAMSAGRRARAETRIGEGPVSFGYAAVELAAQIFSKLAECSVLTLGAGETATTVTRSLAEKGAIDIKVANRTRERADELASELEVIEVIDFSERIEALSSADLVVAATSAPEAILTRDVLADAMQKRRNRPLLVVDLGVPRDVDPRSGDLQNLFLHDIDSLQGLIGRTLEHRRQEVPAVGRIIDEELERFEVWLGSLEAKPLVAQLHRRAELIREKELAAHRAKFPVDTHEHLDALTRSIVRRLLHHPSTQLRGGSTRDLEHLAAFRELFQLDDED